MSDRALISRRVFAGGALLLGLGRNGALAQGFAGLGKNAEGFAPVVPGKVFSFPADHGPHPDYRIEWWYLTANFRTPPEQPSASNGPCFGKRRGPARSWKAGPISSYGWVTQL